MTKAALVLGVVLGALGASWTQPKEARCWDCEAKKCAFDTQCGGPMCRCQKGSGDINGNCVSK